MHNGSPGPGPGPGGRGPGPGPGAPGPGPGPPPRSHEQTDAFGVRRFQSGRGRAVSARLLEKIMFPTFTKLSMFSYNRLLRSVMTVTNQDHVNENAWSEKRPSRNAVFKSLCRKPFAPNTRLLGDLEKRFSRFPRKPYLSTATYTS